MPAVRGRVRARAHGDREEGEVAVQALPAPAAHPVAHRWRGPRRRRGGRGRAGHGRRRRLRALRGRRGCLGAGAGGEQQETEGDGGGEALQTGSRVRREDAGGNLTPRPPLRPTERGSRKRESEAESEAGVGSGSGKRRRRGKAEAESGSRPGPNRRRRLWKSRTWSGGKPVRGATAACRTRSGSARPRGG